MNNIKLTKTGLSLQKLCSSYEKKGKYEKKPLKSLFTYNITEFFPWQQLTDSFESY